MLSNQPSVKELLVSATAGTPGDWSLLITGHSLGGALAQLMATELVGSVDVSRGFKAREDGSLFGMAKRAFTATKQSFPGMQLPRWVWVRFRVRANPKPNPNLPGHEAPQVGLRLPHKPTALGLGLGL